MSQWLGRTLPGALLARFDSGSRPQLGRAIVLVTLDAQARPHPALLSDGEVVAPSPGSIRLATYANSNTSKNLAGRRAFTLILVEPEGAHYVKCVVSAGPAPVSGHPSLAAFEAEVEAVLEDSPREEVEGATRVTSGIRYEAADAESHQQRGNELRRRLGES